jgi:hypothetical protein
MTAPQPVETINLDIYEHPALPWSRALERLPVDLPEIATAQFLSTTGPDGRPHTTGIGGQWLNGNLYFTSGPGTRKSRNLAANPACTLAVRLQGLDLVLEGDAVRVTHAETLEEVAAGYREGGWPVGVEGDGFTAPFSAPSAGPPPWHLFRLALTQAVGVATAEPHGATRWRFGRG